MCPGTAAPEKGARSNARRPEKPAIEAMTLQDAIWLLHSFSTLHRASFDPALFAQRYPPPVSLVALEEAAAELGLLFESSKRGLESALAWRLPVAVLVDSLPASASTPSDEPASSVSWMLVLNADEHRAFVLERGCTTPITLTLPELEARYRGLAVSLMPQAARASDPDGVDVHAARFDLRWFLPALRKHKALWREVVVASLVLQLMALSLPLFTQAVIDKVVVHRTTSTLIAIAVAMVVMTVFTGVLSWVRQYLVLHTGRRIDAVLGSQVFDKLFRLPLAYFHHRPTGVIAARLQGIESIREFIASAAITLVLDFPFLLIFLAIMFWYSVKLTLIVLAILALIVGASALVAPVFRSRLNEQFRRGATNQAYLTEYVAGMETVKSLQLEPQLTQRYRGLLNEYLNASFSTSQLGNSYNTWATSLEQLMSLLILVIGAWIVMGSSEFTIGMLVAFQMFASRISQPTLRMVGLWQQWQQTRIAISRLGDIMNAPAEPYSLAPRRSAATAAGTIEVEGLAFRYADSLPYLFEDLTFTIAPGKLVAIMGSSGAGKSTLSKLLQGFYGATRGRIRIDGVDVNHLAANELRSTFGVVPQETVLFSGTLLDNLKLANPYATFEQIVAACRMAEIHGVIEALPGGYQTEIGERGAGLSGGQRQRISIARALLRGPKVLIFDEATSSVDQLTAEQLGRTINALKGRVTILFIAHQVPRALQPDQVMRIGDKLAVVSSEKSEPADVGRPSGMPA
jgi:ATP-binding cassette, subfamily B, bacterial HlyB/CyaB